MNNSLRQVERQTWVAPLGVRFWDDIAGRVVGDGLRVIAYPTGQDTPKVQAFTNRSGVYVWRNLPGLRDFEHGANDAAFLANVPLPTRPFTVEVVDSLRRFQPFSLAVDVPLRGLFTWTCEQQSSPPELTSTMVPLFSAPTREAAVIRALLWDVTVDLPAAWAVLEAWIAGRRAARSFADANGQVALIFPSPAPVGPAFDPSGPPLGGGTNTALAEQTWLVQLQARYAPKHPVPLIPDLCATLQQAPAPLWSDAARTVQLQEVTLKFGQELVVRSQDATSRSVLLISPAET